MFDLERIDGQARLWAAFVRLNTGIVLQEIADLFHRCHTTDPEGRPTAAEAHAILLANK
jgi:hypothetical protein